MSGHVLFLTGRLAEANLRRVLEGLAPLPFRWEIRQLGVSVAALLTAEMIARRLPGAGGAERIVVPGRCRGDLEALAARYGVPVERGPEELMDLPEYLGRDGGGPPDLSEHDVRIFAEITDAPRLTVAAILERAAALAADGADVIDLGCLPDTPFPHLAEAVEALCGAGHRVSVDSLRPEDLIAGDRAGAAFLLSLTPETLWVAEETAAVPVLIPGPDGGLEALGASLEWMAERGRPCIADPVLDPIHFGFADSLVRYHTLRGRYPGAELMLGVGNLTELTEADTTGINALLFGFASELGIRHVLTTQVSPHCASAVREADLARRIMFRARAEQRLPKRLHGGLAAHRERRPFPYTPEEIAAAAGAVRDPNFRIQVSRAGIHVYNRDGVRSGSDPFELYPALGVEGDGGHAFYLGVELARAEIAHRLGKRYVQDQPLDWGSVVRPPAVDLERQAAPGPTRRRRA
ncbi:DUF6513 domain-containing protein [Thioalbus denitrificans]|uniref:Dihydropteroate synthase-like protein n=1 Tax=Thioalbus denitrificans TaxID=547122 RepID=A0A369CC50_9GAMM|nr:DUF6513 domain-containing protein [Thioalbus denitrificans]RCX30197.1 dihydropteroate synthase-like protein [Thioalbus denitrificans]